MATVSTTGSTIMATVTHPLTPSLLPFTSLPLPNTRQTTKNVIELRRNTFRSCCYTRMEMLFLAHHWKQFVSIFLYLFWASLWRWRHLLVGYVISYHPHPLQKKENNKRKLWYFNYWISEFRPFTNYNTTCVRHFICFRVRHRSRGILWLWFKLEMNTLLQQLCELVNVRMETKSRDIFNLPPSKGSRRFSKNEAQLAKNGMRVKFALCQLLLFLKFLPLKTFAVVYK